jgi:hypothetical protein
MKRLPHWGSCESKQNSSRDMDRAGQRPVAPAPTEAPNEINYNHGGRSVYFDDPSGHHFELITQPYSADA